MAQTLKDYLDEKLSTNSLRAPDRNPLIAPQVNLATKIKSLLNQYETKKLGNIDSPWNNYGAGHSIGDLLFGQSPELLDDMSYGLNPFTKGHTGHIPIPDKRLLDMPIPTPTEGVLGVIKNKGGNWLTGSVENALKGLKRGSQDAIDNVGQYGGFDAAIATSREKDHPINQWIDNTLTKYIKNRMATPDDEVRKLADQGILHYTPMDYQNNNSRIAVKEAADRIRNRENTSQLGISNLAKDWEDLSDVNMWPRSIGDMNSAQINKDPWINKLDQETAKINSFDNPSKFGFDHIIDELLNSTNPASGLPMNLRMKPEGFNGLSMEEAVKKVNGINQHRALQAEISRRQMSKAEGIPISKQYDDGFRFVSPDDVTTNPKHRDYVQDAGKRGVWCTQGDACDTYSGGDSRVHILLDSFGNPHAQIATSDARNSLLDDPDLLHDFWSKQSDEYRSHYEDPLTSRGMLPQVYDSPEFEQLVAKTPPVITQIKPIGNSWNHEKVQELIAKDPNYKAAIQDKLQDFVKSGNWSKIDDLNNAGLYNKSDLTPEEQLLVNSDYPTLDEVSKLKGKDWTPLDDSIDY